MIWHPMSHSQNNDDSFHRRMYVSAGLNVLSCLSLSKYSGMLVTNVRGMFNPSAHWNVFFSERCIIRVGVAMTVCRMTRCCNSFLLGLNVYFNCKFRYSWYYDMDIDTMWHCALISWPQSIALVLWCALFWCWVSICVPFTNSLIQCYFIMIVATIIGICMAILFILNYIFELSVAR